MDKRIRCSVQDQLLSSRQGRESQLKPARSTSAAVISIGEVYPPQTSSSTTNAARLVATIKYDTSMTASESLAQMQDPKVNAAGHKGNALHRLEQDGSITFVSSPRAETSKNPNALYELSRPVAEHIRLTFSFHIRGVIKVMPNSKALSQSPQL